MRVDVKLMLCVNITKSITRYTTKIPMRHVSNTVEYNPFWFKTRFPSGQGDFLEVLSERVRSFIFEVFDLNVILKVSKKPFRISNKIAVQNEIPCQAHNDCLQIWGTLRHSFVSALLFRHVLCLSTSYLWISRWELVCSDKCFEGEI